MPMKEAQAGADPDAFRKIEVEIANGKTTPQAYRDAQITVADVLPLAEAEPSQATPRAREGNSKLKRLAAELSLEKQILKDVAEGTSKL